MMVGIKSSGSLSTAYLHALDYAKQSVQGPDLTRAADKTAPRVPISRHPDVRRSLMLQKAYAEGLRALYMYAAAHAYEFGVTLVPGVDADLAARVLDLLLPIVKGVGSEKSYQWINESLQTLGGSGFLKDYPISNISETPGSTRFTKAPPRSSHWTSCSASRARPGRRFRTCRQPDRRVHRQHHRRPAQGRARTPGGRPVGRAGDDRHAYHVSACRRT